MCAGGGLLVVVGVLTAQRCYYWCSAVPLVEALPADGVFNLQCSKQVVLLVVVVVVVVGCLVVVVVVVLFLLRWCWWLFLCLFVMLPTPIPRHRHQHRTDITLS